MHTSFPASWDNALDRISAFGDNGNMPKRSRIDSPDADANQVAARIVAEATEGDSEDEATKAEISAYAKLLGSRGGKKGGRARANKLSEARRSEIGRKGAAARWRGHKKKTKRKTQKKGRTKPQTDTVEEKRESDA